MILTQNWVGYLDRSYEQIKASLLQRLTINTPEISDHNESNILIVILSMFAGIAEMLNLYIDNMAREAFVGTARKYTSLVKLVRLIDYRISARIPSTVDLVFFIVDNAGDLADTPTDIFIPKGSVINSSNNLPFVLQQDVTILGNTSSSKGGASQYEIVSAQNIGITDGTSGQQIVLPDDYANGTIVLTINLIEWTLTDSLGLLTRYDKKFVVDILEDGNAYIIFGDGINGAIPPNNQTIFADYYITEGSLGNLPPNNITDLQNVISVPTGLTLSVTNPDYSSNGADFETSEQIRQRAPLSIRTLYRAVTYQDYNDLAILAPGVGKAVVNYCCGKVIDIFVSPLSRGIATTVLLNNTGIYFEKKRMLGTKVNIVPAGITRIFIRATLYGAPLYTSDKIFTEAIGALNEEYGYENSTINNTIKISSIVTTLENLESVDSLDLVKLYIEPYLRASNDSNNKPPISFGEISSRIGHEYKLIYHKDINSYDVYRDGIYKGFAIPDIPFSTTILDPLVMSFTIGQISTISDLSQFTFSVFPSFPENFPDYSIEVKDETIPIFDILTPATDISLPTIFSSITTVVAVGSSFKKPIC